MTVIETSKANPANPRPVEAAKSERKRIPMSLPVPKLSVPDIPGYHLHWFLGDARCQRALQAGYEFVEQEETDLNDRGVAGGEGRGMGSRVTLHGGDVDQQGNAQALYLMKIREEYWQEDQKVLEAKSSSMLDALRVGEQANAGAPSDSDMSHRYTGEVNKNIFKPVKRRA